MASAIAAEDILPSDAEPIVDFTCQSPWERFAHKIELTFRAWNISDGRFPQPFPSLPDQNRDKQGILSGLETTHSLTETVDLADRTFSLELRSEAEDHSLDAPPLQRVLGVHQCVLLRAESTDGVVAEHSSDATSLLSAMTVAASSCGCTLPLVVPVGRPSSFRFIGRRVGALRMSRFCCDYNNFLPDKFAHLAGLLELFSSKRSAARRTAVPKTKDTVISAKVVYDWTDFSCKINPQPNSFAADRRLSAVQEEALLEYDPVRMVQLSCLWDAFDAEELTQDRAAMPASSASRIRLTPCPELVETLTSQHIPAGRIPLTSSVRACLRLAVKAARGPDFIAPGAPLPLLDTKRRVGEAKYVPSIVSIYGGPKSDFHGNTSTAENRHRSGTGRIPLPSALEDFLTQAKQFLAAAAMEDKELDDEYLSSAIAALFDSSTRGVMGDVVEALGPILSELSLAERLGKLLGSLVSMNAVKYLWSLFLDGVEIHWEQRWMIAGVYFHPGHGPYLYDNLVVQKLQMINCCVDREHVRKLESEEKADDSLGRKTKLDNLSLVTPPDESGAMEVDVWEPYVQPIPLVTRDLVEAEQDRLVTGVDVNQRNRGESKTLSSDMMAFKAANPTASMADFVRWFSPSDWVEVDDEEKDNGNDDVTGTTNESCTPSVSSIASDTVLLRDGGSTTRKDSGESAPSVVDIASDAAPVLNNEKGFGDTGSKTRKSGRLSARMQNPGNEWEELWAAAKPIPAHQQKGLFDTEAHGRQALNDLRNMPLAQVLLQLGVVVGNSSSQLLHDAFTKPPALTPVRSDIERAKSYFRDATAALSLHIDAGTGSATAAFEADANRVAEAADALSVAEHMALCTTSLLRKLPPTDTFAQAAGELAQGAKFTVSDRLDRELLVKLAGLADGPWRPPLLPKYREFLLEGKRDGTKPVDRMYAQLSSEEFQTAFQLGIEYGT